MTPGPAGMPEDGVVDTSPNRLLLRGGSVYSPAHPHATALAVASGAVVWVGDDAGAGHYAEDADQVVELDGALVTPAFVDAHAHLAQTGQALISLDLSTARSLIEALDALEGFARGGAGLLVGFGWDETRWPERRHPTMAEIDRAVGDRPAYLARVDVHSAVVSSALVARLPQLGGRDGWDGAGRVERDAHHAVRGAVQSMVSPAERRSAIERALGQAASLGIGAVHELGAPHLSLPADFTQIREMRGVPEVLGYWAALGDTDTAAELGCLGSAGDLCADGAIGSRTAAMTSPYADADTRGHRYLEVEDVTDHVVACTRAGVQAGFHCIGDDAVSTVIDGFRRAADVVGREALVAARHRLEHVEMIDAAGIATMAALGIVASVQPMFDARWGAAGGLYDERLGSRHAAMNPFGSLARAGVVLAFGSDTPVTPFDPWGAVRAARWHHDPEERISVPAAFAAHTRGGWQAARRDEEGVLAPSRPATFAVWDVPGGSGVPQLPPLDPDEEPPGCLRTYLRGELIHQARGAGE